jgi:putative membrane protein
MPRFKLILALVITVLILILILQNLESCTTRFLFFTVTMPRALLLALTLGAGLVIGLIMGLIRGREGKDTGSVND